MSDKIELNRRRVLGGLVTIGAAGAAVGAGTFALFSDEEQSTGNTIQAGTLDLGSPNTSGFGLTNLVPTDTVNATITSSYTGSVDASVEISDITLSESDGATNSTDISATAFAEYFRVDTADLTVGGTTTDILNTLSDGNGNNRVDLDDLATNAPYTASNNATDGDNVEFALDLTFVDTANQNDAQGDGVDVDVTLYAEQL